MKGWEIFALFSHLFCLETLFFNQWLKLMTIAYNRARKIENVEWRIDNTSGFIYSYFILHK
jgi:hypothetical protein